MQLAVKNPINEIVTALVLLCIFLSQTLAECIIPVSDGTGGEIQLMSLPYFLEDTFPLKNYGFGTHF